ncbi:MAG: SPOR domain-containing protein [Pseudomonadota bacterium]
MENRNEMVQDFAKDRGPARTRGRQQQVSHTPASRGPLLAGLLIGTVFGVLISAAAYLSGLIPAPPSENVAANNGQQQVDEAAQNRLSEELEQAATRLQLEFYQELPNYEVVVDSTPLNPDRGAEGRSTSAPEPASSPAPDSGTETVADGYMIQAGAFQQQSSAESRRDQLIGLGLRTRVTKEALLGRTLYLVQAGPYPDRASLGRAERILRENNIESMRIAPGSR